MQQATPAAFVLPSLPKAQSLLSQPSNASSARRMATSSAQLPSTQLVPVQMPTASSAYLQFQARGREEEVGRPVLRQQAGRIGQRAQRGSISNQPLQGLQCRQRQQVLAGKWDSGPERHRVALL